jgi:hypothetical protein
MHFVPYIKLKVYRNGVLLSPANDVIKYRLTATHLSINVRDVVPISTSPEYIKVVLSRGVMINGVQTVLDSSKFTPITGFVDKVTSKNFYPNTELECELIPPNNISIAGDGSYTSVITAFCAAVGFNVEFQNPGAAYWGYQFMPTGTVLALNNAQLFLPLLMQKRLIFAQDAGGQTIRFYCALDVPGGAADAACEPVLMSLGTGFYGRRRFFATDESLVVRFAGTVGDPLFNLGFIKSTEPLPNVYDQSEPLKFDNFIDLRFYDGDKYDVNQQLYTIYPAQVTEIFDPKHPLRWWQHIEQRLYFTNTEGGSLPADLLKISSYMPLNTSLFNGVLNAQANNVQSAMEMLDDHSHGGGAPPTTTAANDFQVGSSAPTGSWIKKTLAETITILRTSLDSIYQAALGFTAENVANKDTDNTLAANDDTRYPSQKAIKYYVDNKPGSAADHVVANTTALTHTEGYLRWDSTRKHVILWDAQRERGITPLGWLPFAYPQHFVANGTYTTAYAIAANGGSFAIPMLLIAPMLLESVTLWNTDTASARKWGWDLYEQYLNNGNAGENTLTRVAASSADESFTATVASKRTITAGSAPVFLPPGLYWLVIQSRHATSTFGLGTASISGFVNNHHQVKTTGNPNGATLDLVAATWTKINGSIPAVRMNGRVFGQTTAF